jgi:hypothetical protein
MMEPVTLGVIAAALVAKALSRAEGKALDEGEAALGRGVGALRRRFSGANDREGTKALELVELAPDSPKLVGELANLLDERAAGHPDFRGALEALVKDARAAGVDVNAVRQGATGEQIVQTAQVEGSQITVNFGTEPGGRGITGPED